MTRQALIAGGGIGGLAAALACARAGWEVRLFERAPAFSEIGAGIQMGPNVMRILHGWGLSQALAEVAAFPDALEVRDAVSGDTLARLRLGDVAAQRYGAPYATAHRADLHAVLAQAVRARGEVRLNLGQTVQAFAQTGDDATVRTEVGAAVQGDILIGADGLWSPVRQWLLRDGLPTPTGHLAYRALPAQSSLPEALRSQQVTAWLGPRLHVVQYPVRGGEQLNVVAIVHGRIDADPDNWDHGTNAADLRLAMAGTCARLRDLLDAAGAVQGWRLWVLCDRPPLRGAHEQAQGRVALLGDAAHPMRPYLAQGAGMAIEDAAELERVLATEVLDPPAMLRRYALNRWQRNARVQARAVRNGQIFHAKGPLRLGRNLSLRFLGERLLDVPWLYRGSEQA